MILPVWLAVTLLVLALAVVAWLARTVKEWQAKWLIAHSARVLAEAKVQAYDVELAAYKNALARAEEARDAMQQRVQGIVEQMALLEKARMQRELEPAQPVMGIPDPEVRAAEELRNAEIEAGADQLLAYAKSQGISMTRASAREQALAMLAEAGGGPTL